MSCKSTCDFTDVQASIYGRKIDARPFYTIHDILWCFSFVQSHLKGRNAPIWRIGNRRVNQFEINFVTHHKGSSRVFCYRYENEPLGRNTAHRKCKLDGGSLLYFENSQENQDFLFLPIWLGINNINKRRENVFRNWFVDTNYRWEVSKRIPFENWSSKAIR